MPRQKQCGQREELDEAKREPDHESAKLEHLGHRTVDEKRHEESREHRCRRGEQGKNPPSYAGPTPHSEERGELRVVLDGHPGATGRAKSGKGGVAVEDHSGTGVEGTAGGATTTGVGAYGDLSIEALNDPNSPLSQRVIYFAFDSSEVAEQDRPLVEAHAAFLVANPTVKVSVEGHTDERGSREYNIGLGERRAQAVRRMLMIQGVPSDQISTVSFGEERPVAFGSSESDYAQNRRVEFTYPN